MKGHEHYQQAETLLHTMEYDCDLSETEKQRLVAGAEVHALLALAAAQAMPTVCRFLGDDRAVTDWGHALGWQPPFAVEAGEVDF